MQTISVVKRWHVLPSVVYRYSDPEYVEEFFSTGKLRLSPLVSYKQYEDSHRGDKGEGHSARFIVGAEGNGPTIAAGISIGDNALAFCTSLTLSDQMKTDFGQGVFKIKDTRAFGIEISQHLAGFVEGLEGPCLYEHRTSELRVPGLSLDDLRVSPGSNNLDMGKFFERVQAAGGPQEYFRKPVSYQHQAEYRMIWLMRQPCKSHVVIECPELVQLCERV